jgi:hypothetical protein
VTTALTRTSEPTPAAGGRSRRWGPTWLWALGLVVLHLLVTFQVRPHPRWNDGLFVLNDAASFPDLTRDLDHHALRIGTILPTRLFLEVFGYGQVAYYAWPFLTGALLVVAVFALGTLLFGRWVAAVATVLLVFHPALVDTVIKVGQERMTSWQLLPDIPSTAFVTLGLALLVAGADRDRQTGRSASTLWFLGAGLSVGWAYLVRELVVFVFPVVAVALLMWRAPLRRWVQVAAGMLACLLLELVVNAWAHGDPLARLRVGSEHGSAPTDPITRMDALLRFPRIVAVYPQTVAVLATLVLMVLGAVLLRGRGRVLMLVWFVSMWLPLTLVSGLLDPGYIRINASLMRYWVPVLPALCLGATAAVGEFLSRVRRHALTDRPQLGTAVIAAVAGLALALWCLPLVDDIAGNPRDRAWNAMREALAANDARIDTVVTDDRDALVLGIYAREPLGGERVLHARVERTGHDLRAAPPANGDAGRWLIWTPTMSKRPPRADDGWQVVLRERQLRLYAPTPRG